MIEIEMQIRQKKKAQSKWSFSVTWTLEYMMYLCVCVIYDMSDSIRWITFLFSSCFSVSTSVPTCSQQMIKHLLMTQQTVLYAWVTPQLCACVWEVLHAPYLHHNSFVHPHVIFIYIFIHIFVCVYIISTAVI